MTRTEADLAATIATVAEDIVVDTDAFVTTIKRRHRRRRRLHLAVAGGATAVLAIGVGVPAALLAGRAGPGPVPTAVPTGPVGGWATMPRTFTGACTAEAIPTPIDVEPGHPIWLTNVDPSGRYVVGTYGPPVGPDDSWGNSDSATGRVLPIRWDNGVGRVLPIGGEGLADVHPRAVNRHGAVVGDLRTRDAGGNAWVAWVSLDGTTWSMLPTPPGYDDAYPVAITDDNIILGRAYSPQAGPEAVMWTVDGNGGWRAHVQTTDWRNDTMGITEDGWVVGNTAGGMPHVWYPDGTDEDLPTPDGTTWGRVTQVRGDFAIGFVGRPDEDRPFEREITHVVRWNLRTGELSIVGDRPQSDWSGAVNARGDVAWLSASGAVLVRDGQTYELTVPRQVRTQTMLVEPVAMNDDATLILGIGVLWWC